MTRTRVRPWLALSLSAGWLAGAPAGAQTLPNPSVGGPYGSLPTHVCSDEAGALCYAPDGVAPLGTSAEVTPYMDNAARNWGCQWSLGHNAAADLGEGNWSKWYGTEFDPAYGCGLVYWSHARQAAYFVSYAARGGNVAAASRGATVSVSSVYNLGTPASSLIDGNRRGHVWGSGGGWSSLHNPTAASPQWIQVNLAGARTIGEIVVTTLQDAYNHPIEPTTATAFTTYGIRNFTVQYWNGSAWATLGSAVNNSSVVRRFTFTPVSTAYIRVHITAALQNYARVVEVEAFETASTSAQIAHRYLGLGAHRGALGYPVSNPSPFGWTGATYQQFANGIVTYANGAGSALHVGGSGPEEQALAAKYADAFGISPTTGPAAYALKETGCTNAFGSGCGEGQTGRYLLWLDTFQLADEMLVARSGSPVAVRVTAPIRNKWTERYGALGPWNGELGFPIADLLPTGSASYHQEFEHGTIVWERSACASGPYTARIVAQFRRPISEANLSMLCEASAPANTRYSPPSAPVPFSVAGGSGSYGFHSSLEATGWYKGVTVKFDGAPPIDVTGPIYTAWIGGAWGDGNVADALAGGAAGWGEPASSATCEGNPCTVVTQRFAHGTVHWTGGGEIAWDPDVAGLTAPIGFGPYERGYANPPMPFDRRALQGVHRSGDYIKLAWLNKATLPGLTTRIYRSVKPLNGVPGPWTVIQTYPPPTAPAGSFSYYTDLTPPNNSRNCYFLEVTDGFSVESTPMACTFTLDATEVGGVDRSMVRGVGRAQVEIAVPASPSDSGSTNLVGVSVHALGSGFESNFTYLDTTAADFTLGSVRRYDLIVDSVRDIADIDGFSVVAFKDNLRISHVKLILDNVVVFQKAFDPPFLVSNSYAPGGRQLEVGFDELRSNPLWNSIYSTDPQLFLGYNRDDFRAKVDTALANAVFNTPGAAYHGSRLRDGYTTELSKPKFGRSDVIHVRQRIVADVHNGIYCTLDYNLRIHAKDIYGNEVSAFYGGPYYEWDQPVIYTTEIKVERPNVDCGSSSWWKGLLKGIFSFGTYPFTMADLESNLEQSLRAQGPSQIQSSPPKHRHFCFPGPGQGLGEPFRNGGLTVCTDNGF